MKKLICHIIFISLILGNFQLSLAQDHDKNQTIKLKSGNSEIVIDDSKIQIIAEDTEKERTTKRGVSFGVLGGINSTLSKIPIEVDLCYYDDDGYNISDTCDISYYLRGYPAIGVNFGLSLNIPLSKRFSLQTDPIYSLQRVRAPDLGFIIKQISLDIPLLGIINFNDNINFLFGPYLSFKANYKYENGWFNYYGLSGGLVVGGTYQLNNGLFFSPRYQLLNFDYYDVYDENTVQSNVYVVKEQGWNGSGFDEVVYPNFNSFQFIIGYRYTFKKQPFKYNLKNREILVKAQDMEEAKSDIATGNPKPDLSFFSIEELKEMYKQAIKDKDDENISLIQKELTNRTEISDKAAETTAQTRGGGDPLKGLNISKATKQMEIGNYFALIIGIDNYKGTWLPLKNAVGDAKAVENLLRTKYKIDHFRILYNEFATRKNIMKELSWLVDNVNENDNVFIYYSGHGDYKQKLNKGYWVPVEAQTTETYEYISNSEIQTYLNGIKSKHTLLVSDACFSGDIFRGTTISVPFEQTSIYYTKVHTLRSRQAFTSGGVEPVMDGGREGHSVFTYYLLEMLKRNEGKYYDAGQLYNDMKIPVTNNSDQTPMLQPIKNTGDEGGQFIFIKK